MTKKSSTLVLVIAILISGAIIALVIFSEKSKTQNVNTNITTSSQETDNTFAEWFENQQTSGVRAENTEDISQVLLTEYLQSENISKLTDQEKKEIIQDAINSFSIEYNHFAKDDFEIIETSPKTLKTYGNSLAQIIQKPEATEQNEIEIVFEALAKDNPKILAKLEPIKIGYQSITEEIKKMPVPEEVSEAHLLLSNTTKTIENALGSFSRIFDDPAPALLYMQEYSNIAQGLTESLGEITTIFVENNISFTQDDDGYIFISRL